MSLDATRWAWTRADLSAIEKLVLLALADRADERDSCFPGIETLAHDTSANRKTIMGALRSLEASGLIEVERANGAGNRYRLVGVEHRTSPKNGTGTEMGTSPKNGTAPVPKTGRLPVPNLGLESTIESTNNLKTPKSPPDADAPAGTFPADAQTPRERGENARAQGRNPRANGTNPRATAENPRAERKRPRINLATDADVARAFRTHFGKDPPLGASLEDCRALFWKRYRPPQPTEATA